MDRQTRIETGNRFYSAFYRPDFKRYETIDAEPLGGARDWLLIQRVKYPEKLHYCASFHGSGKYFSTMRELNAYTAERWALVFDEGTPRKEQNPA